MTADIEGNIVDNTDNTEDTEDTANIEDSNKPTIPATPPVDNTDASSNNNQSEDDKSSITDNLNMPEVINDPISAIAQFEEGDYIKFGRYYPKGYTKENNDGEISWVITKSDSESGELTLVSEYILDILPYDTAESGIFDKDKEGNSYDRNLLDTYSPEKLVEFRGNSDWEKSNIRTWLNSDAATVTYKDSAPVDSASDEYANGYKGNSGFLHDFTKRELDVIQFSKIKTPSNVLDEPSNIGFSLQKGLLSDLEDVNMKNVVNKTTKDRAFLLSISEVKEYVDKGIFQPFTKPTTSALASDDSPWLKIFEADKGDANYLWATRTPLEGYPHLVVVIGTGNNDIDFNNYWAAISGHGIRPAMVIKPIDFSFNGNGTSADPYIINFN